MEAEQTTKSNALPIGAKFGVILGLSSIAISLLFYVVNFNVIEHQWVGNSVNALLAVAAVIFAHKTFKESGNGYMSYGQGLGTAMVTVVVSMILTGIYSYIFFNFIDPSFFEAIWTKAAADMEAQGQSEETIEMGLGWARKLFWPFFILGGLFWGFIIGLIVSIFTQKRAPETAF
jgi:hypothetical protein